MTQPHKYCMICMLSYTLFDYITELFCETRIKSGKVYLTEHSGGFVWEMDMDRRQQKTREAIFKAFGRMLEKKSYNHITVQEIIDEANIGRSTFYAHFETKDDLLNAICRQIFGHVFSDVLNAEEHHDFSKGNNTLPDKLTHLLCHLKEQKKDIIPVLSGESSDLFMRYFKAYLEQLFTDYAACEIYAAPGAAALVSIPEDFVINHYVSGFAEAVKWWAGSAMKAAPENIVEYYMALNQGLHGEAKHSPFSFHAEAGTAASP